MPKMMSIRQVASTGILPETALRRMVKEGRLPVIYIGRKALINYDLLVDFLNREDKPNA